MREEEDEKKGFTVVDRRFWADDRGEGADGACDDNVPSKPTYVQQLEHELEEKDRRLQEYINQHKELLSEFEGARARIQRDVTKEVEQSRRSLIVELLDVLDNLDRALETSEGAELSSLVEGVTLVRDLFVSKLRNHDIHRIDAVGQRFDPTLHDAMSVVPVNEPAMDGQVVGVLREGYRIGDETLRPVGVAVARQR